MKRRDKDPKLPENQVLLVAFALENGLDALRSAAWDKRFSDTRAVTIELKDMCDYLLGILPVE